MLPPRPTPDGISAHLAPGASVRRSTSFTAPVEATVGARFVGGANLLSIHAIETTQVFRRPATEADLEGLPPHLRDEVQENGVEERRTHTFAGSSSAHVSENTLVRFVIEVAAQSIAADGISIATLILESSGWESIELPVMIVVGHGTANYTVPQEQIRKALVPGESSSSSVIITNAPTGGPVTAFVIDGGTVVRIQALVASKSVRRELTPEEIETFPPSLREDAIRRGFVEFVETARSDGRHPIVVSAGDMVQVHLVFDAPRRGFTNITDSTLVIDSPRWQRKEIPLRLLIGRIEIEMVSGSININQGGTTEIVVAVRSWTGPGTTVDFSLNGNVDIRMAPATLHVNARERVTARLTVFASNNLPIGPGSVTLEARAFEQLQQHRIPLLITIVPGGLQVGTRPWSLTARQGERVSYEVWAHSEGPARTLHFKPGTLPRGVRGEPAQFTIGPGRASQARPMHFVVDRDAPLQSNAFAPIHWWVDGHSHMGVLNLPLTINRNPEERLFRRDIATPAGTALGGFAEVIVRNDGTYVFRGHMHGSGFDPYSFRISVTIRSSRGNVALGAFKSGHVGGSLGSASRDCDWSEPGLSFLAKDAWPFVRDATAEFTFWYENAGVLGTLEDIGVILVEFIVGAVAIHPGIAAIVILGSELGRIAEVPFAHPSILPGVIVAGSICLLLGPWMLVPAVIAGGMAGAQIKTRRLRESEIAEAAKVFGDTLPIDRILVTNLSRGHRAFCIPHVDGSILMGLGGVSHEGIDRFDEPMKHLAWRCTLIHELAHAWQIENNPTLIDMVWSATINLGREIDGEDIYAIPTSFDGRQWSQFDMEQQARIVESWYEGARGAADGAVPPSSDIERFGMGRWEYPYIQNNIRLGQI